MHRLLFTVLITLSYFHTIAQSTTPDTTYFLQEHPRLLETKNVAAADFYTLVSSPFRWKFTGKMKIYHLNHKPAGFYTYQDGLPDGAFETHYPEGTVHSKGTMKAGLAFGQLLEYYRNEGLKTERDFRDTLKSEKISVSEYVINHWDSLGNQLIKEGNGKFKTYHPDQSLAQSGEYKEGKKYSYWMVYAKDGSKLYEETYHDGGVLKNGLSYDEDGNEYTYTKIKESPSFPNGRNGWANFLQTNLKYPERSIEMGVEGTVIILFTLNKEGYVMEPQVLRGVSRDCDAEALRVINLSPRWNPGKLRGKTVESKARAPITFRLTN